MLKLWTKGLTAAALVAGLVVALGCSQAPPTQAPAPGKGKEKDKPKDDDDDHAGWWCKSHGVPEDECSMCSDKVYKECKAKGDICDKHPDRAKSQCFICNPALWDKYAARHKEKEGTDAPLPKNNMPGKK